MTPSGEALLAVAAEVFYTEGIAATGVDAVAARAGISKPTLYAQFGSKRELVAAVLTRRHEKQRDSWQAYLSGVDGDGARRLLSVFDWLARWHAEHGSRGCAFLNAAAETTDPDDPARRVVTAHKRWLRDSLAELARAAELDDPEPVADAFLLLIDGANARVLVDGDTGAAADARWAAARLLDASHDGLARHG